MRHDDTLTTARLRLMLDQPYLASALARLPFIDATATDWCNTMATDGYHVFYDHHFVESLSEADIRFVLAHELLHCVLGHIDRREQRDATRWNIAIDYATNALLVSAGLPMPPIGFFEPAYKSMTAEEIYERLPQPGQWGFSKLFGKPGTGRVQDKADTGRADESQRGFDHHLDPDDDRRSVLGSVLGDMPSREERRRLRAHLAKELTQKLQGSAAGRALAELQAATTYAVPWETFLRQFLTGLRRADYRMFPFNKKHLWRGLYLPSVGTPGPQHLVVAVDTSGSMSDSDLQTIAGELDGLRSVSECKLTILHFDTVVEHVDVREAYETTHLGGYQRFYGRGGTNICAPFDWLIAETTTGRLFPHPDAIVVVTDGFGPMPTVEPSLPVLWIATPSAIPEFPYGTTIRLPARR